MRTTDPERCRPIQYQHRPESPSLDHTSYWVSMPPFFLFTVSNGTQTFYREVVMWKKLTHPEVLPSLGATINPWLAQVIWLKNSNSLRVAAECRPDRDHVSDDPALTRLDFASSSEGMALSWLGGPLNYHGELIN